MDEQLVTQIRTLAEPILTERGMELVELTCRSQGRQLVVRLLVDRAGGVTIQQCAQVNRLLGESLDAASLLAQSYTIEVSSPGLDRPLVSKRDFESALGEDLQLDLTIGDGRFKELQGMLLAVQQEAVVLKTREGNVTIPLAQIRTAKKALRW